ncbi:MAG TPA: glycoside hydrolase family 16 protein [Polyangia bacterium]|nr:glycoside hydrolase family 16 protein [Polyangia bacterium]
MAVEHTTRALTGSSFVPSGYGCVWHDEFGGAQGLGEARANLDETSWSFQEINVNSELQAYTTRQCLASPDHWNLCVEDGRLRILGRHESIVCDANNDGVVDNPDCAPHYTEPFHASANYTSGRLITKHKVHFPDGYIEFRVKLPEADRAGAPESGMWPAVWMLGESINQGPAPGSTAWPNCGEIDIMEWATSGGVSHQGWNAIWNGPGGTNACSAWPQNGNAACGPCPVANGECVGEVVNGTRYEMTGWTGFDHHAWHTYGFKWENTGNNTTDQMTYFIDGVRMGVLHLGAEQAAFKNDMFLTINLALGGTLGGPIAVTDWNDAYVDLDYVRWYRAGQTEACGLADGTRPPLHWRGGLAGCPSGSLFSNASCWSTSSGGASAGVAPAANDNVVFDGGGVGNCAIDANLPTHASSLTTTSAYTGTIAATLAGLTVTGPTTLGGGTFNSGASTTSFAGPFTMTGTATFDGGTGTTTFAAAPTLTSGTFVVGDAGSSGAVVLSSGATFASGTTLAFPTSGGTLSAPGGQAITINGAVTSHAGATATPPRIARSGGTTGLAISFGSTSVLDLDGLELDDAVSTGVAIADGATTTRLAHLAFKNNVAASATTGATHLVITSSNPGGTKVIAASGCFFDATAQFNVTLNGVAGSTGVRAAFENQGTNGPRAGESFDLDADTNDDNVADSTAAPRFGSVIEWVYASPSDTTGTPLGAPAPALDWNTFVFYGVYVAFKNVGGPGTADRLWLRNTDGSSAYFYDVPDASGDLAGPPRWDTINETTAGLDVNGDGDQTDTDVRVVYLATTIGHIIKLIDTGSAFARPASGPWATDFTDGNVQAITSPLISDGTNLYFGGTGGGATKIFGVQLTGGANEKALQKNIATVGTGAITTSPAWVAYGGATYLFLASAAVAGQAIIYRAQVSPGATIDTSYLGVTTNVNGAMNVINDRAFAVTQGGQLFVLAASSFVAGGFTTLAGFPYTTSPAKPIVATASLDPFTNVAYFGDSAGRVFVVTAAGASFSPAYPYQLAGTSAVMGTPLYRHGSGTIAIGASDGYVYFLNRQDATGTPQLRKRIFVGGTAAPSISYDNSTAHYLATSNDGHMLFIAASDVGVDTDGLE